MSRMMLAAAVILLLVASTATAASPDPKHMVLGLQAMPTGFSVKSAGYSSIAEVAKDETNVTLAQLRGWGYLTGYVVDYGVQASIADDLDGPVEIVTTASVYATPAGAEESLQASAAVALRGGEKELSLGGPLGDDGHLYTDTEKVKGRETTFEAVLWRHGRIKAGLLAVGLAGTMSPSQVVRLARAQDKLIG